MSLNNDNNHDKEKKSAKKHTLSSSAGGQGGGNEVCTSDDEVSFYERKLRWSSRLAAIEAETTADLLDTHATDEAMEEDNGEVSFYERKLLWSSRLDAIEAATTTDLPDTHVTEEAMMEEDNGGSNQEEEEERTRPGAFAIGGIDSHIGSSYTTSIDDDGAPADDEVPTAVVVDDDQLRRDLFAQAARAQVVQDQDEDDDIAKALRQRLLVCTIVVVSLLVVGLVVGLVFGLTDVGDRSSINASPLTNPVTLAPVWAGLTYEPTVRPSVQPSRMPTMYPTASQRPSSSPTIPPDNDFCNQSTPLISDGSFVTGDLQNATLDNALFLWGGDIGRGTGVSRWYSYVGEGMPASIEWCSNSTSVEIAVLVGECEDNPFEYVSGGGYYHEPDAMPCPLTKTTGFDTVVGQIYYIVVFHPETGFWGPDPTLDTNDTSYLLSIRNNDECTGARELDYFPWNGGRQSVSSFALASPDPMIDFPPCREVDLSHLGIYGPELPSRDPNSSGVWYKVVGPDKAATMTLFTCGIPSQTDLVISVFSGQLDQCNFLTCEGVFNTVCFGTTYPQGFNERVDWVSKPSVVYYILVQSRVPNVEGSFDLELHVGPPNDICNGALEIQHFNSSVPGVLEGATVEEITSAFGSFLTCDGIEAQYPGVWYKFNGTDQEVTVIIDADVADNSDATVSVFLQGQLQDYCVGDCVTAGSWFNTSWFANSGTMYYILVQHSSTNVEFRFKIVD